MNTRLCASLMSAGRSAAFALLAGTVTIAGVAEAAKPVGGGKAKPIIAVSLSSVPFGNQAINTTSAVRSVLVTNSGTANLLISGVTKTGTGSASFGYSNGCPATLAPSAVCAISVTFSPASAGAVAASIVITSNASNGSTTTIALSGNGTTTVASVRRVEGAGDSIMRGYNATCTRNTGLFDFLCYSGGDQPENSFLDGSSAPVTSIVDRYIQLDSQVTGGKAASASGSEMTDLAKNNFATQASAILNSATQPVRVFVELGGNDICNRATTADLYTDGQWETAVRGGLDVLTEGLPNGSTVLLVSVPRVQDLRAAGIAKQTSTSGVNCENFWASYDVCRIGTAAGADLPTRLASIGVRQRAYNDKLVALAGEYNGRALSTGVEVVAEFDSTVNASVGSYAFQATDINGGDCFHPSIQGQNKLSEIIWGRNPYK
jgi:GDSL-like Lipase/Acylhydrolase